MAEENEKNYVEAYGTDEKSEKIAKQYSFGELSKDDVDTAIWIADFIDQNPELKGPVLSELLRKKFRIKSLPIRKVEDSIFYHTFGKELVDKLGIMSSGWKETPTERIPHIGFSADLDDLDNISNELVKKLKKIPESE